MEAKRILAAAMACSFMLFASYSYAADSEEFSNQQIYKMLLEAQQRIADLEARLDSEQTKAPAVEQASTSKEKSRNYGHKSGSGGFIGTSSEYNYKVLDHAEFTNTKQLVQLRAKQYGQLNNRLTIGGQVTAIANYQESNTDTKFGWLMRHPTSKNQIGETVSEAVVHSSNLNVTANLTDNLTAYFELLYNPEQNFASGSTITGLPRNNVNMRKAYVMWGNLDNAPYYAAIGKMDIPFGMNDTVSPFTNSTNWHAFAGLAYGANFGYATDNLHIRAMAIQGGAQFRNANTPVKNTNVPSRLNNFAIDANYTFNLGDASSLNAGASYQYGSSYCQAYPVLHFNPCDENNDAIAVYGKLKHGNLMVIGEFATTLKEWPGTANPIFPGYVDFGPQKVTSFSAGARYGVDVSLPSPVDLSLEFSRFKSGANGSPWERQKQWVAGASYFVSPSANFFGELVLAKGWVPLNFLSGGNKDPNLAIPIPALHDSWSDQNVDTKVIVIGVQAAF